jgi:isorenieratene synthase
VAGLRAGQRYSVVRVWIEGAVPEAALPVFVITERARVLDAIAMLHRVEEGARTWAEQHRGSVLELHCYAVPDDVPDDAIVAGMLEEAFAALPVLAGGRVVRHHLQVKADFAAFHVGMHATRPGVRSPVPGLWFCGDWVALPFPAMLMEAAYASGLLVANAILEDAGIRGFPVHAVPPKGILTTLRVPEPSLE